MKISTLRLLVTTFAVVSIFAPAVIADTRPSFHAMRVTKAPIIDGDLSDEAWQKAEEITGFTQHDPDDGKPATQANFANVAEAAQALKISPRTADRVWAFARAWLHRELTDTAADPES